jgi:hypothetical protein
VLVRDREHPDAAAFVWRAHNGLVTGLAMSGDGRWVVSGGVDGAIWVGDREHPQAQLEGRQSRQALIASLAMSGDGRFVASGGDDGTARVWRRDEPTAAPLMWQGHDASVNGIALSRDGRVLVAGQGDRTIWTGTVGVADLKAKACKLAARKLRGAEWQLYIGNTPYRETCPGQARPGKSETPAANVSAAAPGNSLLPNDGCPPTHRRLASRGSDGRVAK